MLDLVGPKNIDYFEDDPEKEKQLEKVRKQILEKFLIALEKFKKSDKKTRRTFNDFLKTVWEETDGHRVKAKFYLEFNGFEKITVIFDGSSGYYSEDRIMTINLNPIFDESRLASAAELDVYQDIYHETEHIYYKGADLDETEESREKRRVDYLGNSGEIRAFGRQFALLYEYHYPNEDFSLNKMIEIAKKYKETRPIHLYFIDFNNEESQNIYKQYGNPRKIHQSVVELTERFVKKSLEKPHDQSLGELIQKTRGVVSEAVT